MNDLFDKLAASEDSLYKSQFLSPVINGGKIRVNLNGVNISFNIKAGYNGFGVFKPISSNRAKLVRPATPVERLQYLTLFPDCVMMVVDQEKHLACLLIDDGRFRITGVVPVLLPETLALFDPIKVRFDGTNFWYDSHYRRFSPVVVDKLREAINYQVKPEKIEVEGLTNRIRVCYNEVYQRQLILAQSTTEYKVKSAVERAGGRFSSYKEVGNRYSVEYFVEGERHTSLVNKDTFRVESAGICLNGTDASFDLQSLISVVREGRDRGLIVRVGHNR